MSSWLALCLLSGLVSASQPEELESQIPSLSIRTWTAEDGLPQNSVTGVSLDSKGYLWVATYGGLAKFDGQKFQVFDVSNRPDLPGNRFGSVLTGINGDLWVQVEGVGLVHYQDDLFQPIPEAWPVKGIALDNQGRLWSGTRRGVGIWDGEQIRVMSQGLFVSLLPTRSGVIWLGMKEGGIRWIDSEGNSVPASAEGLPQEPFPVLFQDHKSRIWAFNGEGTWRATDSTNHAFTRLKTGPAGVIAVAEARNGDLWFACKDQLVHWNSGSDTFAQAAQGHFSSVAVDQSGAVWAGSTKGGGLSCLRSTPLRNPAAELELEKRDTWSITGGREGKIYISQDNLLFEVGQDQTVRHEFPDVIRCVLLDRSNCLWVSQLSELVQIQGQKRTTHFIRGGKEIGIRLLYEGSDGTLWVGAITGLWSLTEQGFVKFPDSSIINVRCMIEDPETGDLWIGTQGGLARIQGESVSWITAKQGLSPGSVRSLHFDSERVLWAATYGGGLSRLHNDSICRYSVADGLADNFLACILEDRFGRLWLNSNKGPFVVEIEELNRFAQGELNYLTSVHFWHGNRVVEANGGNQPSGMQTQAGEIWFPTIRGVVVADPKLLPVEEASPQVFLESVELTEKRKFTASFTALGFAAPERVRIQYSLRGHDSEWIEGTDQREVNYSYLPPGKYEFMVRARNGFSAWSDPVGKSFHVKASLHERPEFLLAIAVVATLSLLGIAQLRIRASRARAAKLEQLIEQRDRAEIYLNRSRSELRKLSRELLRVQESERSQLSRELHDDVTQRLAALAIQAEFVESKLIHKPAEAGSELRELIERAQGLAKDVQQLSRRLHPVGLRTLGLAQALRQEVESFSRRSHLEVHFMNQPEVDKVPEEVAVAAFRIFQESLRNVEKHADAENLRLVVTIEDAELSLTVSDDGRGFVSEAEDISGLGLVTMRERAATVGGRLRITSKPGEGTTVRFFAPVPKAEL
ncbi:MAG: hypothetical protein DWQ01_07125 [Planctomycetota bacterium]|nr:MAG: hypothetical protein DWQ01_07125 [Planctomycetota bacterium]